MHAQKPPPTDREPTDVTEDVVTNLGDRCGDESPRTGTRCTRPDGHGGFHRAPHPSIASALMSWGWVVEPAEVETAGEAM